MTNLHPKQHAYALMCLFEAGVAYSGRIEDCVGCRRVFLSSDKQSRHIRIFLRLQEAQQYPSCMLPFVRFEMKMVNQLDAAKSITRGASDLQCGVCNILA